MKRIVIDVDGVLCAFNNAFRRILTQHGAQLQPFEDGHNPLMWDWYEPYGATQEQARAAWEWVEKHPGWWATLAPHHDFEEKTQKLLDRLLCQHEVTFVSSRPGGRDFLVQWLKYYLAAYDAPQVLLTPGDKVLALAAIQPHVVIEDRLETLRDYREMRPGAAELILIRRPYTSGEISGLTVVESTLEALERAEAHDITREAV